MTYGDPKRVRKKHIKIYFNEYELEAAREYCDANGYELAVYGREKILEPLRAATKFINRQASNVYPLRRATDGDIRYCLSA